MDQIYRLGTNNPASSSVNGDWCCRVCGKQSRNRSHLMAHVEARHFNTAGFMCPSCQKVYKTRDSLRLHKLKTPACQVVKNASMPLEARRSRRMAVAIDIPPPPPVAATPFVVGECVSLADSSHVEQDMKQGQDIVYSSLDIQEPDY